MERPSKRLRTTLVDEPDPSDHLQRDRYRNDIRLKGALEDIFVKYTKDFTDVGDEIDLQTGEIVVNNGHISRMRDEQDVGEDNVSAVLNAFAEDIVDGMSDGEGTEERHGAVFKSRLPRNFATEDPATDEGDPNDEVGQPSADEIDTYSRRRKSSHIGRTPPVGRQKPDVAAIEALGQSIGLQIAQFIGQYQCTPSTLNNLWTAPPLPQRMPHRRNASASLSIPRQRRPVSPRSGSIWAVPDPVTGVRPIQSVARRLASERRSLPRDVATPHRDCHGEDQDYASNEDDVDNDKSNFPIYLDKSRQHPANTSAKRAGPGRKSLYRYSDEDDKLLIELKEEHHFPWATICSYWPDRPPWTVQHYYHTHLKRRNTDTADSGSRDLEGATLQTGEPTTSEGRAISRTSEALRVPYHYGREDPHAISSPIQPRPRPYRQPKAGSTVGLSRKTLVNQSPELGDLDFDQPNAQPPTTRLSSQSRTSSGRDSLEVVYSPMPSESGSSPDVLESVKPAIAPKSVSARKNALESSDRKYIAGRVSGLSSVKTSPSNKTSLSGPTPPKARATSRAERPPVAEEDSDDGPVGSSTLNLVSISNLVASPKASARRRQTTGSSARKPKNRRVSDGRGPTKSQHTPSEGSKLKCTIAMYDDDDSPDELALI